MIGVLAGILCLLLLIGIIAMFCELSVYIIPAIFVCWLLKMIEKFWDKK